MDQTIRGTGYYGIRNAYSFAVKDYYRPSTAVLFKRDKPDTIQPYGHVCDCMNGNG